LAIQDYLRIREMQERSEEQIISRLFELENTGQAERRTELGGERFLSLIQDPDSGRAYVFSHAMDVTEGAEIPPGTEFWEYPTQDEASRAYGQLLAESGQEGDVVEEDSEEGIGDSDSAGAEVRDRYSASDEDDLVNTDTEDSVDDLK
jgi:hypothetical protein